MDDILTCAASVGVVAILLMVLALQLQMRNMAHKVDSILEKIA